MDGYDQKLPYLESLCKLLPWAESAQSTTICDAHVDALASSDICMDHDPQKLSRE